MKSDFSKRTIKMLISVILMGVAVKFLLLTNWGADPWTTINSALSSRTGVSFGTCELITNIMLLVIVFWKDKSLLGLGTVCNMILVGYSADFTGWAVERLFGTLQFDSPVSKTLVIVPALIVFVFTAGIYMHSNLGTAPYDAFCNLIHLRLCKMTGKSIKFRLVRMTYDGVMALIGFLAGGKVGIVTVGIILTMGPAVDLVGHLLNKNK